MGKLRVGLIGCGSAAAGHAMRMSGSGRIEIVGLTDTSEQSLKRMRERVPAVAHAPSFHEAEEMYEAVDLDAVTIVTPHTLHYTQVMGAVKRGLHVLCEKPLTCESAHAREIEAAADAAGVTVMIRYQRRFDPAFLYMRRAIESGELGELESIAITCGQDWMRRTTTGWRQTPELSGGGMLMDSGAHVTDALLWLANRPVESVSALVDTLGTDVDINTAATVGFAGGLQGQLTVVGNLRATWMESIMVSGTQGMLRYEVEPQHPWRTGRVVHYRDGNIVQPLKLDGVPEQHLAWLDAIRGEENNPSPPSAGIRVAELTEAIYRSAREGRTIGLEAA